MKSYTLKQILAGASLVASLLSVYAYTANIVSAYQALGIVAISIASYLVIK